MTTTPLDCIIPDTSILIEGMLSAGIIAKTLIPKHILIHEATLSELEAQANTGREVGYLGLSELHKLHALKKTYGFTIGFAGTRPSMEDITLARKGGIDSLIRNLAFEMKATLITLDRVQALAAEAKGVHVLLLNTSKTLNPLHIDQYFDAKTMSVHLKEHSLPKAKKGTPGNWKFVELSSAPLTTELMQAIAKELIEHATLRADGFIEHERAYSTLIQLGTYRIVIVRPPLSDGYEITIVKPITSLTLSDYTLAPELLERIAHHAEGILIAGPPGHGKSTFAKALAEHYLLTGKILKTIESPRDLVFEKNTSHTVTQYAIAQAVHTELHDLLLLSRPDYTLFDEARSTEDFKLFSDLRLSGVGMIGVVHGAAPIDAIQRFLGRIELGIIPHVIDTVIFIHEGKIAKVFLIAMVIKVPHGMTEADLARPVVVVRDFETGKLEFELYSYGEETVVVPITSRPVSPAGKLAAQIIQKEFEKFSDYARVEMVSDHKCTVYVPVEKKALIIGKNGQTIARIEEKLGISIDLRELNERASTREDIISYTVKLDKKNITFTLQPGSEDKDSDIYVNDARIVTVKSAKKGVIKINMQSIPGRTILHAINEHEKVEIRQ